MIEKTKKINNAMIQQIIWVIALSLIATYGITYRIIEPRIAVFFLIPIIIYWLLKRRLTTVDLPMIFLLGGMNFYAVYEYRVEPMSKLIYTDMVYFWIFPIIYIFGKIIIGEDKQCVAKKCITVIVTLGIAMYIQALLDYYAQYTVPFEKVAHAWPAFWDNFDVNSRNIYDLNFLIITAALFFLFIERKKYKKLFILSIIAECIALYFNVINQGRTNIVQLLLVLFVSVMIYSINNWRTFGKKIKLLIVSTATLFIGVIGIISAMISLGMIDSGLDENDKFWARGGGIFKNIRFNMAREGFYKAITLGKGGWEIYSGDLNTTHNTYLEYARLSDSTISCLVFLFALTTMIIGMILLVKYNKKDSTVYLLVGVQLAFFAYFFVEPCGFATKKLYCLYVFVAGIVTGYYEVIKSSDYQLMHQKATKSYQNIAVLILAYAMLNLVYIDYWCDRLSITLLLLPIAIYLLGEKCPRRDILLVASTVVCSILIIIAWYISKDTDYWLAGYVFEPITRIVIKKVYIIGLAIIPISVISGFVLNKLRLGKWAAIVTPVVFLILYYHNRIKDGRWANIKEAMGLWLHNPWGSFTVTSSETLSSHSMWLDYARDYGITVTIPLLMFAIVCAYRFIKLIILKERCSWIDYVIVCAFVLFGVYFTIEVVPYERKYLFYLGLMICGMLETPHRSA